MLQLKADTEAAAALIRGANERNAAAKLREEAAHEAEKEHLAAKGLNPYKVSSNLRVVPCRTGTSSTATAYYGQMEPSYM